MKAKSGKLSKCEGLCICEQGGISISTYYFLPTRNVFGRGASKEAGQLKLAFDRLFAVAECGPDLANPQKESVLLMAAEGHGFEETLYWYDHLEQHLGWKSLGKVLCGGVMDLGDIAGREELHQAFELGRSIS